MPSTTIYTNYAPQVIAEVIDEEAIIVNLDSGAYYSLRGAGAAIWEMAGQGWNADRIAAACAQRFEGESDQIQAAVARLLAELTAEGLLVAAGAAPDASPLGNGEAPAAPAGRRQPFGEPVLEKYTDMADLLLLDPIHEVGAQGWPAPRPKK